MNVPSQWQRPSTTSGPALALVYTMIAVVMTWPLMRHPASHVASDLGDPLFICWVLMWTGGQVLAALRGDLGALSSYWHGNIFYPERWTVAYSEHFTPQMLQMLPLYAAGGNILLCYNLLFLSTFVVTALGMYLFVRDLTSRPLAAFLAGLAFAYAPYRLGQLPHLQVLSSGWMPFALLGVRRFFITGRVRALVGGATAFVVQGLSCGYYLLFFAPLLAAYALYETIRRGLLKNQRVWTHLLVTAAGVGLVVWPFLWPYAHLHATATLAVRSTDEVALFSADTHAFATIAPAARLLGTALVGYLKPEGQGFPGFTILAFAAVSLVAATSRAIRRLPWRSRPLWQVALWSALATVTALATITTLAIFAHGRLILATSSWLLVVQEATTLMWIALVASLALGVLTRAMQASGADPDPAAPLFWFATAVTAALLAFGPAIYATGHLVARGPYTWLLAHVPGFDGLRVPARFLTIVTLALAVLAGVGASTLQRVLDRRTGTAVLTVGIVLLLLESWMAPMALDQRVVPEGLLAPGVPRVGRDINPLYRMVKTLPGSVVLVEFPFGEPAYDIRAVFYAGYHRRPLVNGYSGFFPAHYGDFEAVLGPAPADPDAVRRVLVSSGATHAVVHTWAYPDGRGDRIVAWLISQGAQTIGTAEMDTLLQLNFRDR